MPAATTDPTESLTPEDINKLTSDLSSEIDEEIKKQLSQPHPFSETQTKVDQVVKQAQETTVQAEKNKAEAFSANINPPTQPQTTSASPPTIDPILTNPDPLQASLSMALANLKEGDQVGDDWVLKKIYSTSFGHNQSFFYELENKAGAKWTLSPEEMREVLKSRVKANPSPEPLAPPTIETTKKPDLIEKDFATLSTSVSEKPESTDIKQEPTAQLVKEKDEEIDQPLDLSEAQIEFLSKLHNDIKLWQAFTSFSKEQLTQVQSLYEKGQLLKLGIDAHPLLDQVNSNTLGKEVDIKKEDSFTSLAQKEGHSLSYSSKDAILLGLHIILNNKLLNETAKKAQAAGLSIEPIQEPKEIIALTTSALLGNNSALQRLTSVLQILPTNSKFRILSTEEVKNLEKYFAQ